MKNPRMLYRVGTKLKTDDGAMDYIIVPESDVKNALSKGWFLDTPSAARITSTAIDARSALEEKAQKLNVKFDGRTSDAKLAAKIEAALNGLD